MFLLKQIMRVLFVLKYPPSGFCVFEKIFKNVEHYSCLCTALHIHITDWQFKIKRNLSCLGTAPNHCFSFVPSHPTCSPVGSPKIKKPQKSCTSVNGLDSEQALTPQAFPFPHYSDHFGWAQKLKSLHQKYLRTYLTWNDFERDILRWLFHFRTWQRIQRGRYNIKNDSRTQKNTSLGLGSKRSHTTASITKTSRIKKLLISSISLTCWWVCKRWIINLEANLRAMVWPSGLRKQGKGHIRNPAISAIISSLEENQPALNYFWLSPMGIFQAEHLEFLH